MIQNDKNQEKHQLGMIGLGVMGRNLLLNLAEHGYMVAGYDLDPLKAQALRQEAVLKPVLVVKELKELAASLHSPRVLMMLVPAGPAVDTVINDLLPHLDAGDVVIDGGNSHFKDTERRGKYLAGKGIYFLGVGVSGGEAGARHGPCLMAGGPKEGYSLVAQLFEAAAAKVNGSSCSAFLGKSSAGHYVKMVHNGIEYGLMRLIAECYDLLHRGLELDNDEMGDVFDEWNSGELRGYLIEITAQIFRQLDERTGKPLLDLIRDEAAQKGTGIWDSQAAMDLGIPVPTIDMAVAMRSMSALKYEREQAHRIFDLPTAVIRTARGVFIAELREALYMAMLITYAQGMAQLRAASDTYGYELHLDEVARIWRGGCIIRSDILDAVRASFLARPGLPNLLLDPVLAQEMIKRHSHLRAVIVRAAWAGLPVPALMASLAYFDNYRSAWQAANLIQAQRDYFGAHTYERVDAPGAFHTHWGPEKETL
jgi:6-phosphogluconate dehydrogenase